METMTNIEPEPRWPTAIAMISIGGLFYALPSAMTVGPDWLVLALVAILILPAWFFHKRRMHQVNQIFGYLGQGVVTVSLAASLVILVVRLPSHKDTPAELLRAAAALWVSNMLVFASWYWRLDAGGPNQRDLVHSHTDGAFLFPQMVLDPELRRRWARTAGGRDSSTICSWRSTPARRFRRPMCRCCRDGRKC